MRVAALMGLLAVALGAFGAHGLQNTLVQNNTTDIWKTASWYHLLHAVMLFVLGTRQPVRTGPWLCFFAGILIFSGSLYLLAVTNLKWLGAITPLGGVGLLAGWLWLCLKPDKTAW